VLSYVPMRAHVVLDDELVDEVDALTGRRRRSAFIEDAVREKLQRERQTRALEKYIESGERPDHPNWRTPEDTSRWVRQMRELDNQRLERKLRGTPG
jgi:predicted transcriptional regulator